MSPAISASQLRYLNIRRALLALVFCPVLPALARGMTMQGLGSRRSSYSTADTVESHRSLTSENPGASSSSTFIDGAPSASDVTSSSEVVAVSYSSPAQRLHIALVGGGSGEHPSRSGSGPSGHSTPLPISCVQRGQHSGINPSEEMALQVKQLPFPPERRSIQPV